MSVKLGKAKVSVPHPMSDVHFIKYIWAKNQDNKIIAAVKLKSNEVADLEFFIPKGTTAISGYEACNK